MSITDAKIENWKQKLLDLSKRNKMLNFKEAKRSNIQLIKPSIEDIFNYIVINGKTMEFIQVDDQTDMFNYDDVSEVSKASYLNIELKKNQLLTNRTDKEMIRTLIQIRRKARTGIEERGVNTLYLAFGFLEWKETDYSNIILKSPVLLVPIELKLESMLDAFKITMSDDVIINPTLQFKLENDFNIKLPQIEDLEDININDFFNKIENIVSKKKWVIKKEVYLSLFSFLKINMYEDLDKHADLAKSHPIIRALTGDSSEIKDIPEDLSNNYDHDLKTKPIETFQVVDADSSQQDAIIAAKKNISFILQGPPGTGKSQTITNIIAECLADGKKVLFVSEKMAALDVVYKRLEEVGLTDFCLQLHSYKAKKKTVLEELGKTLNHVRIQTREQAIADLEQLYEYRNKLNEYDKSLHEKCEPLGKSIYQIHGELMKYYLAPDIIFNFDNVNKCTQTDINKYKRLLNEFARTSDKMGDDYVSNPWYGSNIKEFKFETQHNIITHFNKFRDHILITYKCIKDVSNKANIKEFNSIKIIKKLHNIFKVALNSTYPPIEWIKTEKYDYLMSNATTYHESKKEHLINVKYIESKYNDGIYKENTKILLEEIDQLILYSMNALKSEAAKNNNDLVFNREKITNKIRTIKESFVEINTNINKVEDITGTKGYCNIDKSIELNTLLCYILKNPKPLEEWFDDRFFSIVTKKYSEMVTIYNKLNENKNNLLQEFDVEILECEYKSILTRFRTNYTNFLKVFKSSYHKDVKYFRSISKTINKKYSDEELISYLTMLQNYSDSNRWFNENNNELIKMFGKWYLKLETNWKALGEALKAFENIINYFNNQKMPDKLKELLINPDENFEILEQTNKVLNKYINNFELVKETQEIIELHNIKNEKFGIIIEYIDSLIQNTQKLYDTYDEINEYISIDYRNTLDNIIQDLNIIEKIKVFECDINNNSTKLKDEFKSNFIGIETDWEKIINSLKWANEFKLTIENVDVSDEFISLICDNREFVSYLKKLEDKISPLIYQIDIQLEYLNSLFDEDYRDFDSINILDLENKLKKCTDNFMLLEEWIDYKQSRIKCNDNGLGEFINKVIKLKLPNNKIVDSFFKRFYRLWLDEKYKEFPSVRSFRRINHEKLINEFRELDRKQQVIARTRIIEMLSAKLPSTSGMLSGGGEISILKKELSKRRRIMPLRKLFKNIPNLLMTLKPCLMMSPLSVSFFIEPDYYEFDVVIFDEASQVCPEDAVGAIYRAKQVIIAGDCEQLPPTNFFNAALAESEYEDDELSGLEGYESILDEGRSILPEISLRWHYRSKHEDLITFSNAKIYAKNHQSLITFPAAIDKVKNNGVEYIYIPNGIYDRSITRANKIEAKKVAEFVFEHFKSTPNRSLGVIAFSEAQRNAIENEIRYIRGKNKEFEKFFNEDNEEQFFVKNLENVQGDERDTIFFSIGYAKDINGVMHMNFGPLNRDGGYRRLNVAITRAKYNVKLITSLKPTDIDLDRTNSDGVRMLRSYIEYAIRGPEYIINEITESNNEDTESPFEDEVYKFLLDKGYRVATQIGSSGYRIDLAIKHPSLSGRYVLGIECDGATYHASRTARERDRLKESVLVDRGWNIYRIWSTDWIKGRVNEEKRLIDAISNSFEGYNEEKYISNNFNENSEIAFSTDSFSIELEENYNNNLQFEKYVTVDISSIGKNYGEKDFEYLRRLISHIVSIESPIHIELLCKRLLPLFGREKITSYVRKSVDYICKDINNVIKRENFYWDTNKIENINVRINPEGEEIRKIEYICKQELAEAMYEIIKNRFGIDLDNLFIDTARIFGFNRTGEKIKGALMEGIIYLQELNKVNILGEKASIKND